MNAEVIKAIEEEDSRKLREISERVFDKAVLDQNKQEVERAILYYAVSKILGKVHFKKEKQWETFKSKLIEYLEQKKDIPEILKHVTEFDREYGNYLGNVVQKARMKYASTAYAFGLSLSTACELTGADLTEVSAYVGQTKIHEKPFTQTRSVRERLKNARKLLEEES